MPRYRVVESVRAETRPAMVAEKPMIGKQNDSRLGTCELEQALRYQVTKAIGPGHHVLINLKFPFAYPFMRGG